ncbi:DUF6686 family protein [Chitinophagaceae bacterium MMS25-I14]
MCSYRVLSKNNCGYIVSCGACNAIQLAFYTTCIRMEAVSFYEFSKRIGQESKLYSACEEPALKQIHIDLGDGVSMCLSASELTILDEMMSEAAALLEAYRILDVFAA